MSEAQEPSTRAELEAKLAALKVIHETYTLEKNAKAKAIQTAVSELLRLLDATPVNKPVGISNADLLFWRGKALSFPAEYNKEAETHLSKAIKLEPSMVQVLPSLR
jgi:tetratricopeptide (TPR) repeat protein